MPQYKLRQRLVSFGEDFDVTDAKGHRVFHIDGKLLRIRETFVIEDLDGKEVATVRQKLIAVRKTMRITRDGELLASIRKALIAPFRDKWTIEMADGEELVAQGSILDHEYEIRRGDDVVATISKRWFTIRDTYGIDVRADEDAGLIIAIAVAIDEMAHDPDEEES